MGVVKVILNGVTKMDITPTTADASEVNQGDVFFNRSGEQSVGTSDHAKEQQIAYVESGTTASRAYDVGEYFCWNGLLYRVASEISSGATFTPGTNCEQTTVGGEISETNQFLSERFLTISTAAGKTVTITTELGVCGILMNISGSTDARTGAYWLQGWSASASDRVSTAIKASSSVTITGITNGWQITTGTGTRTFSLFVMQGKVSSITVA